MLCKVFEPRCQEWGVPLYISTNDFTKAFDRIKHSSLWSSLEHFGIKPANVKLLQRIYSHQESTVLTDKESDVFRSNEGRNKVTHCRACCSIQYYSFHWRMISRDGKKNKKASDKRQKRRLNDKFKICGRRALVLDITGKTDRNAMRLQEKYRGSGSENPPGENKDTKQSRKRSRKTRARSTTSKLKSCQKATVHDT